MKGKYDVYLMNLDGTENRNIIPDYFPSDFLCYACYAPIFSKDDALMFIRGQWWE